MRKAFLQYPSFAETSSNGLHARLPQAFAKTTATKKFYDLERSKSAASVRGGLRFDESRCSAEQIAALKTERPELGADVNFEARAVPQVGRARSSSLADERVADAESASSDQRDHPHRRGVARDRGRRGDRRLLTRRASTLSRDFRDDGRQDDVTALYRAVASG